LYFTTPWNKTNSIVIFINQLREKVGVMYGNPEVTTGGRALKFYASVRIDVRRIETLKSGGEVIGNRTRAKVVKNKVAPPFREAELCVPDQGDVRQKIFILQQNIQKNIQNCCNLCYNRFNQLATAQLLQRQHQQLDRRGQELAIAQAAVRQAAQRHVQDARRSLQSAAAVAESLSPYAVLARGYALPEQNGTPCAVETLRPGEAVTLRGARAAAECRVEAVHTLEQKTGE
jgi:hypothetical protein